MPDPTYGNDLQSSTLDDLVPVFANTLEALQDTCLSFQVSPKIFRVAAMRVGGFERDSLVSNKLCQGLLHGLHALRAPSFNICPELMVVSAANEIPNSAGGHQNFNCRIAIDAVDGGQEPLVNDRQQSQGELAADLGLETGWKDIKDARDGLRCVVRVQ